MYCQEIAVVSRSRFLFRSLGMLGSIFVGLEVIISCVWAADWLADQSIFKFIEP